jgi:hypothetical protein
MVVEMLYGEGDRLVKSYNRNGFKAITHQKLYYRLSKRKDNVPEYGTNIVGKSVVAIELTGVTSDNTDEQIPVDVPTNLGGRKKGSKKKAQKEKAHCLEVLIMNCIIPYNEKINKAQKAALFLYLTELKKKKSK